MDQLDKESLAAFERGRRLYLFQQSEGYQDFLDIFEEEVIKDEYRLLNLPAGTSSDLLRDIHAYAKISRSNFERIQIRIATEIENGKQIPIIDSQQYEPTYSNL